jgi:hypothetical protein
MATNRDYNLVDPNNAGGDWMQIHNKHQHGNQNAVSHTHVPVQHSGSRERQSRDTTGTDIDTADAKLRAGDLRERTNMKDKGGPLP